MTHPQGAQLDLKGSGGGLRLRRSFSAKSPLSGGCWIGQAPLSRPGALLCGVLKALQVLPKGRGAHVLASTTEPQASPSAASDPRWGTLPCQTYIYRCILSHSYDSIMPEQKGRPTEYDEPMELKPIHLPQHLIEHAKEAGPDDTLAGGVRYCIEQHMEEDEEHMKHEE